MIRIIDEPGTGKTNQLMLLAKEHNADFICSNPKAMEIKAKAYGIDGINFISYDKFSTVFNHKKEYVIDELESFNQFTFGEKLIGYSITKE